jgi:ketosteroid isomerase-like protein/catechol 2,3-dioxygenase-like lactoylglutathione lyase family enzyme
MSNDILGVVLAGWIEGLRSGDLDAIARHLHPDVVWHGVRADLSCPDRAAVLENLAASAERLPEVSGLELAAAGDQVLLGVRSDDLVEVAGEILESAIYNVFTVSDGLIVRIEDFRTREDAVAAMRARREHPPAAGDRTPATPVSDLIAFVHVADVQRSAAFYELLGFGVTDSHHAGGRLDWVSLRSADAQLMLARAGEPVHRELQAVLFYLYTSDLAALQAHLRGHGVKAGPIVDGSPGPSREMRVRDPDGYVLMIAETDDEAAATPPDGGAGRPGSGG